MHLRHRLQYGLYAAIRGMLRALPHRAARRFGRGVGELAWRLVRRERRIALDNLARALPERPARERQAIARESFRQAGAEACDLISAARFSAEELGQRFDFEGLEHLERAQQGGRGVLLLGAHLGSFEMAGYAVARAAGGLHLVSNTLSNPLFDREVRRMRGPFGIEIIERKGAARRMYKVLARGGRVGVALDQGTRPEEAIDVRFFGIPSLASPLPAYLSQWTGVAVVPMFATAEGGRYRVSVRPPIEPEGEGEGNEAIARLTQRYIDLLEAEIRRHPERWLWLYRRWRPDRDGVAARSSLAVASPAPARTAAEAPAEAALVD